MTRELETPRLEDLGMVRWREKASQKNLAEHHYRSYAARYALAGTTYIIFKATVLPQMRNHQAAYIHAYTHLKDY